MRRTDIRPSRKEDVAVSHGYAPGQYIPAHRDDKRPDIIFRSEARRAQNRIVLVPRARGAFLHVQML